MSETALAAAVVAAVNTALPARHRAYRLDDVPEALPDTYVEVSVHRRFFGDGIRADGSESQRGYRIVTRRVSREAHNVEVLAERLDTALDFATLSVGGVETVVNFESGDPAGPDDGWFSAISYWTCALPITNPK